MLLTPVWTDNGNEPQYVQLYAYIKKEIVAGTLPEKTRLPSVRKLADMLGLSTTPVEMAYQQLLAEGFIISRPRSGYYVEHLPEPEIAPRANRPRDGQAGVDRPLLRDARQYEYDFHMSQNDFSLFPYADWRRLYNQTLRLERQEDLFFGDPQGEPGLRKQIAEYLHQHRGVVCTPDQVVICSDQFGLLSLLSLMLKTDYPQIAVENPGYLLFAHTFARHGFEVKPISLLEDGIDVRELEQSGARLAVVSPSHQYPRGMIMPVAKRMQLLEWAKAVNGYIIEDDYDGEFRYHGRPIPSLQGLQTNARVIYMGSFSQVIAPALCIWYMVLPQSLLDRYYQLVRETLLEQSSSRLHQVTLEAFMKKGMLEKHLRKMRSLYRKKHDAVMHAVQEHFGERAVLFGKDAGFHMLLRVETPHSELQLNERARQAGVHTSSASYTWLRPPAEQHKEFFLGFAGIPLEKIEPGIKALAGAWLD
ncbi:PLP-dependent aminotransferase family protein [Brevibacillus invocatus]|uniref:PLP-dependent aminotransferase family protein n=1 Tax=Brevibacillus invocatus TaxID=173959 RepID=A0A3M8C6J3_9BACL|nr:PLP-dependent aminotransferase family protein [Brevibacillus invocatus]RNB71171.1 PLP-dependent aminotransferase family protein [Brevibacillus invocatus]